MHPTHNQSDAPNRPPLPTAHCPLPIPHCPLPIPHCPLPTARVPLPTAHCLLPCLLAFCLLPSPAHADTTYADSPSFELNLLSFPAGGTGGFHDSSIFALDLRRVQRGWADSAEFILDSNLGDVTIVQAQSYRADDSSLLLVAVIRDTYLGPVTTGTVTWSLRDANQSEVASGDLTYSTAMSAWYAVTNVGSLAPGQYTVISNAVTPWGRTGGGLGSLSVGGGLVRVHGMIRNTPDGAALEDARVALFPAQALWSRVNTYHGGVVPALAVLLAELTPARGPLTTLGDGGYEWNDLPPGGSYVLVAAKDGYLGNYSPSFSLPAGTTEVARDLFLSQESLNTLAALHGDVDALYQAALRVMNRNAETMARLSRRVRSDGMLEDQLFVDELDRAASVFSAAAFVAGWTQFGYKLGQAGLYAFNRKEILTPFLKTAYKHLSLDLVQKSLGMYKDFYLLPQLEAIYDEAVGEFRSMALSRSFPETAGGYQSLSLHTAARDTLAQSRGNFLAGAGGASLASGFNRAVAGRLRGDLVRQAERAGTVSSAFLHPARPQDGVFGLTLPSAENRYLGLSEQNARLLAAKQVFTVIQMAGNAATVVGTVTTVATGPGAPVGAAVGAAGTIVSLGAGVGEALVTGARIGVVEDMESAFEHAYFMAGVDNAQAFKFFDSFVALLNDEAASPKYLKSGNQFASHLSVDLNLSSINLFGTTYEYMFTWGLPRLDMAEGRATVALTNTGNTASDFRVTNYGFWSPVGISELWGHRSSGLVTSCQVHPSSGALTLQPSQQVLLSATFRGHSKNFLSQFKPHYLSAETHSGPWRTGQVVKPYYVLGLGETIKCMVFPLLCLPIQGAAVEMETDTAQPDRVTEADYLAPAASGAGRLSLRDLQQLATGSGLIGEAVLTAEEPTLAVPFVPEAGLYAVDLRVFAPPDADLAALVTDADGARLGLLAADGVVYAEMLGSATDMADRPISLRVLHPVAEGTYTLAVTLLTPGPEGVPVSVFYEPVEVSGAVMTAFPGSVVIDADREETHEILIRVAEASGQERLTDLRATLGTLQLVGGASTLPPPEEPLQVFEGLPAGEQRDVVWEVNLGPQAVRGKYVGVATLSSLETADLHVPVVALVRKAKETVVTFEGPDPATETFEQTITLDGGGSGQTWVHVPAGFRVLHASLGVVGASVDLEDPSIDIGADGSPEWVFDGLFDIGVMVSHLEDAFNTYIAAQTSTVGGVSVPIRIDGSPGETVVLNGIQLFLENHLPGDFHGDGDRDLDDFAFLQACLSGTGAAPTEPGCDAADLDGDGDVDAVDVRILLDCLSGARIPADPDCIP